MPAFESIVVMPLESVGWVLLRLLVFGVGVLFLGSLWDRLIQLSMALRHRWAHRMGVRTGGIKCVLWLAAFGYSLQPVFVVSPAFVALMLGASLVILSTWGRFEVLNAISGIAVSLRAPFSLGDEIVLGSHRGVVEHVGLTRLRLRASDGSHLEIPCSVLATAKLVRPPRDAHSIPVVLVVDGPTTIPPDVAAAAMRDHALLSPYTDPDAPVIATSAGEGRIRIELTPIHSDEAAMLEGDLRARVKLV
ncbi:MAG: mechanosensitive ion channel domain-containing protein [Myxococcota bacterium]|nr:mechanosensitive ion channel domain-containing protein [Myxococcota bacterium]